MGLMMQEGEQQICSCCNVSSESNHDRTSRVQIVGYFTIYLTGIFENLHVIKGKKREEVSSRLKETC